MIARPTDEEIRATAETLKNASALMHLSGKDVIAANMLLAWLTERQAARDGVTDEMLDVATTAYDQAMRDAGYNDEMDDGLSYASPMAMRAALQCITQPLKLPEEKEDLDPVKLRREGRVATDWERGFNEGWNECREAMLSTSPSRSSPY